MSTYSVGVQIKLQIPKDLKDQIKKVQDEVQKHKIDVGVNIPKNVTAQLDNLKNQIKQTQNEIKKFSTTSINGNITKDVTELNTGLTQTQRIVREFTSKGTKITVVDSKNFDELKKLQQQLEIFKIKSGADITKFEKQYKDLYEVGKLDNYKKKIDALKPTTQNLRGEMQKLNAEFGKIKADAFAKGFNSANKSAISLTESLSTAAFKMAVWTGVGGVIFGALRQVGEGVQFIRNLDSAMIDLQKVTNETEATYKSFETEATRLGQSLAKTSVEVVQATANFAKMGYSLREAKELAETALMASNVGDLDVNKASEYLISTMKGFNIQAEESVKILDILNEIQNNHSITVGGLGEAYKRASAVMASAGNTLEQTAALITSSNAIVQNPERVGNAWKTVAMRIQGVDQESGETFPKLEGMLNKVGVAIRNTEGGFRSTYDIIKDLSKVYGDLDDMTRANLLEQMAGKYQANVLASTLTNFAEAEKTLQDALESTGSAARENEKYLESVDAKVKQFQVTLEEMYKNFVSSDLIKGFIDMGSVGVEAITKISGVLGGIPTVAGLATAAMIMFNDTLRKTISEQLTATGITSFGALFQSVKSGATSATVSVGILSAGLTSLKTTLMAVKWEAIATQAVLSLGLSLAITGITIGITKLIESWGKADEAQKNFAEETMAKMGKLQDEVNNSEKLLKSYEELSAKTNLTTQEKQKLLDVQSKIAEIMPDAVKHYTLEGEAILEDTSKIRELLEVKKEQLEFERRQLETDFYANHKQTLDDLTSSQKTLNENKQKMADIENEIRQLSSSPYQDDLFTTKDLRLTTRADEIKRLKDVYNELAQSSTDAQDTINQKLSEFKQQLSAVLQDEQRFAGLTQGNINSFITTYIDNLEKLKGLSVDPSQVLNILDNKSVQSAISSYSKAIDDYRNKSISLEQVEQVKIKVTKELEKAFRSLGKNVPVDIIKSIISAFVPDNIEKTNEQIQQFAINMDSMIKTFNDVGDEVGTYNQLLSDMAQSKKITAQEMMNLIQKYPSLINAFKVENGQIKINAQSIQQLKDARLNEMQTTINAENAKLKTLATSLAQKLKMDMTEIESIQNVADARAKAAGIAAKQTSQYMTDQFGNKIQLRSYDIIKTQAEQELTKYAELKQNLESIKKLQSTISVPNFGVSTSEGKSSSKTDKSAIETQIEKFQSALEKAKIEYLEMKQLLERKVQLGMITGFDVLKERIQQQESYVQKLFDVVSDLDNSLRDYQAKLGQYKVNTKEYNAIKGIIGQINKEKQETINLQQTELTKLRQIENQYKAIMNPMEKLKEKVAEIVDQIKGIGINFKDSIEDVFARMNLNLKFDTDVFGNSSDIFDSISSSYQEFLLQFEKARDDITNTYGEKAEQYFSLLEKIKSKTATEIEKLKWDEIKNQEDITGALQKYGLTQEDILKREKEFSEILTLRSKQQTEIDNSQKLIEKYEEELKQFEQKVDEQEKLNQLKEKELRITELQAEIEKVMADKRFELITTEGQRILTYDTAKVADLQGQMSEAQTDLDDYKYQLDVEKQRESIQAKIDNEREYLEKILPELHQKELEQYAKKWASQLDGELANQLLQRELTNRGVNERIGSIAKELEEKRKLWQATAKNAFEAGYMEVKNYLLGKQAAFNTDPTKKYSPMGVNYSNPDLNKVYQPLQTTTTNTTIIYFGDIQLEGDKASLFLDMLKNLGLVSTSWA